MTITLSWWWLPIGCVAVGFIAAAVFSRGRRGDYDFVGPLISWGFALIGLASAIGIVVGKLVLS